MCLHPFIAHLKLCLPLSSSVLQLPKLGFSSSGPGSGLLSLPLSLLSTAGVLAGSRVGCCQLLLQSLLLCLQLLH